MLFGYFNASYSLWSPDEYQNREGELLEEAIQEV